MRPSAGTSAGSPRLVARKDGYQVAYGGRCLYSDHSPRAAAERRATKQTLQPEAVVVVASPLLGYGLDTLIRRLPASSLIVALELNPDLAELSRRHLSLAAYDAKRAVIAYGTSDRDLLPLFSRISVGRFRRVQLVSLSGGFRLEAAAYRALVARIDEQVRLQWQNRVTTMYMSRMWIANVLSNLPALAVSSQRAGTGSDTPVVVLGAGPSLDVGLTALRARRGSGKTLPLTVAVDTAFPACLNAGIEPDVVIAVEAQQINVLDFVGASRTKSVALIDLSAHPAVARQLPPERRAFFASRFSQTRLFDRLAQAGLLPPRLPALGSVGVAALVIAATLSSGPIIVSGLDFAVLPDATHGSGTTPYIHEWLKSHRLTPFKPFATRLRQLSPGDRGECAKRSDRLLTSALLQSYHDQLEQQVRAIPNTLLDASFYGRSFGASRTCCTARQLQQQIDALMQAALPHPDGEAELRTRRSEAPSELSDIARRTGAILEGSGAQSSAVALRFLNEELQRLKRVDTLARQLVSESTAPTFGADNRSYLELCRVLEECDYVYLDFPDREELPAPTVSFVSRAAASALHFSVRISRTLAISDEESATA